MNNYSSSDHCDCHKNGFADGMFYSLFVGLNDKCTGGQTIPTAQAMTFVQEVCARYFVDGFTILEGSGADRGNSNDIETSIYIMAINATECSVFEVAGILQRQFNQSEILIEKNETKYLYFNN